MNTKSNGIGPSLNTQNRSQLNFLKNALDNVESGWYVVVMLHEFFYVVENSETHEKNIVRFDVSDIITDITDAYESKTNGSYVDSDYNRFEYDFTNANGKMAAIIVGHVHSDYTEQQTPVIGEAGYPIISILQDGIGYPSGLPNDPVRTEGTYTEQAFDIIGIDTTNKVIKTVRIGAGINREFSFE